jgi:hypothetical protein
MRRMTTTLGRAPFLTAFAVTAAMALPAPAMARITGEHPRTPPPHAHAHRGAPTALLPGARRVRGERSETAISLPV